MKKRTQTYNDGLVTIYKVTNGAEKGNMPKDVIVPKDELRYDELKVGLNRFWTAKQAQVNIDRLIRVPRRENVSTQDVAIPIDGKQYSIKQIQYPQDVQPPSMDISLQRLDANYELN